MPTKMPIASYSTRAALRQAIVLPQGRYADLERPWQPTNFWRPLEERGPDGAYKYLLFACFLPRGSAKSTLAGMEAIQVLHFETDWKVYIVARDRDQARIVRGLVESMIRNSGLARLFTIEKDKIIHRVTGSELLVESSDAPSLYGLGSQGRGFYVIIDEIHTWQNEELWNAIWSSLDKLPGRILVISNAYRSSDSVAAHVWELAKANKKWAYHWAPRKFDPGWKAGDWKSRMQAGLVHHSEFERLIENIPSEGSESFLLDDDIKAALRRAPATPGGQPVAIGVDYGRVKDRSALVAAAYDADTGGIDVREVVLLSGTRANPVRLQELERQLEGLVERHAPEMICADPAELRWLIDKYGDRTIRAVDFTPASKVRMATELYDLFSSHLISIPPDKELLRELRGLAVKHYGDDIAWDHPRGGHDDIVTGLGLAADHFLRADWHPRSTFYFSRIGRAGHSDAPAWLYAPRGSPATPVEQLLIQWYGTTSIRLPRCHACSRAAGEEAQLFHLPFVRPDHRDESMTCEQAWERDLVFTAVCPADENQVRSPVGVSA